MRRSEFIQQFCIHAPWESFGEAINERCKVEWAEHQANALEAAGIPFDPETGETK